MSIDKDDFEYGLNFNLLPHADVDVGDYYSNLGSALNSEELEFNPLANLEESDGELNF